MKLRNSMSQNLNDSIETIMATRAGDLQQARAWKVTRVLYHFTALRSLLPATYFFPVFVTSQDDSSIAWNFCQKEKIVSHGQEKKIDSHISKIKFFVNLNLRYQAWITETNINFQKKATRKHVNHWLIETNHLQSVLLYLLKYMYQF